MDDGRIGSMSRPPGRGDGGDIIGIEAGSMMTMLDQSYNRRNTDQGGRRDDDQLMAGGGVERGEGKGRHSKRAVHVLAAGVAGGLGAEVFPAWEQEDGMLPQKNRWSWWGWRHRIPIDHQEDQSLAIRITGIIAHDFIW